MNYIIVYEVKSLLGATLSAGRIRAKNKTTEFEALAGTREHLQKSVPNAREVVIISCEQEVNKATSDFMDFWEGIFNNKK